MARRCHHTHAPHAWWKDAGVGTSWDDQEGPCRALALLMCHARFVDERHLRAMASRKSGRYRASHPCSAQTCWRWDPTKCWCVFSIPFCRIFDNRCTDGRLASVFDFPLPAYSER